MCAGHEQNIIDWELAALQARYRGKSVDQLKQAVTRNFRDIPFGPERSARIFVGNQENIRRRASFTILGLYYPRLEDIGQEDRLF